MFVEILGQIGAGIDRACPIGGPTQRRVMAALVARRGEAVSIDELIDTCWPRGEAPARAEHNVRTYVHRLRTALGPAGDRIATASAGYRLVLETGELDAERLLAASAAVDRTLSIGDHETALEQIESAANLWRGRPYAEFADEPWAEAEAARLTEVHWVLQEQHADALLAAGRARDAVVVLESFVREAPLREHGRGLLMRALFESGRQAEAHRSFRDYRSMLVDEVGVEPSPDLVDIDRAIAAGELESRADRRRVVGDYELVERVAAGPRAVLHRATRVSSVRDVAVKVIGPDIANHPEFVRRFESDAHAVASLDVPGVVSLLDFWRAPGQAYLVSEWMPGGSLAARLHERPMSLGDASALIDRMADVLAAAHDHGIVHGAVGPRNILFDQEGRSFLADFRIAAPERRNGELLDVRDDVAALAMVGLTAVTGRTAPSTATLCGLSPALGAVISEATSEQLDDRHGSILEFASAFGRAASGRQRQRPAGSTGPTARTNPFHGLRSFDEADAGSFHGRGRLIDELVAAMAEPDRRLLAVVGPSGSGKTSLVRAGLVPALRAGRVPGSDRWFITTMVPGQRPFEAVTAALLRVALDPPTDPLDDLRRSDRGLLDVASAIAADADSVVAIVVDQFEEVFLDAVDPDERDAFLRALAVAAAEPGSPVRLVVTLRADFYDEPLRHPGFGQLVKESTIALAALAPDELEEVITEPARRAGVGFESGLVAEMIADANRQPGALPMLQFALMRAFEHSDSGQITVADYRAVGGLSGALARQADSVYADLDADEQAIARRMFGRLVSLGDGADDTRRRARRSEVVDGPGAERVLARFGAARLLTFDRDPSTREPTVEVAHEALIGEWPRLRTWLSDDRDDLLTARHLTAAASAWAQRGHDEGELYQGARLAAADDLRERGLVALDPIESEFLDASVERQQAERELELVRATRLRRLVGLVAAIAVVALVAGVVALRQRNRADDQALIAEVNAALAAEQAADSDRNAALAAQQASIAEQNERLAATRADEADALRSVADIERLRSQALALATERPSVAALLAVEAARLDPGRASDDMLHRVLTAIPGYRGHISSSAFPAALADDGSALVTIGLETVDVWDLTEMRRTSSIPSEVAGNDERVAVSGDGTRYVATGVNGTRVIDLETGERVAQIATNGVGIRFAPDSERISMEVDGRVLVLDAETLTTLVDMRVDGLISGLDWSPDSRSIALVTFAGTVELRDASDGELRWTRDPDPALTGSLGGVLAISPSGDRVIVQFSEQVDDASQPRQVVRSLDPADGSEMREPTISPHRFWTMTPIDPHGDDIIATAPASGTLAYDLDRGEEVESPAPGFGAIGVLYSPALDLVFTWSSAGVDMWNPLGATPLERVVVLPDPLGDSQAAAGGGMSFAVDGDVSLLRASASVEEPSVSIDLESDPPRATVGATEMIGSFGDYTLVIDGDGARLEDENGIRLGDPVPVPPNLVDWAASPDGRFFALTEPGGVVRLHGADGRAVDTLTVPGATTDRNTFVSFSDDGSLVAAFIQGGSNARAVWETENLQPIVTERDLSRLRFYLARDEMYTNRSDLATIERLDPRSLESTGAPLAGHAAALLDVKVDESSGLIATQSADGTVRMWEAATGSQFGRDMPGRGSGMRWSDDGLVLAIPRGDRMSVWNLDTETWPAEACRLAGRNLTAEEWADFGPQTVEYRATCDAYPIQPA